MQTWIRRAGFAGLSLAIILLLTPTVQGQTPSAPTPPQVLNQETLGNTHREITAPADMPAPQAPAIGFIDSPSATCYQPVSTQNVCRINWYYLSVDASPNYMISMTATLNETGPAAEVSGFFQTSMYVPYSMFGPGFQVACGSPGESGIPELGHTYAYTIRARDSANLTSANYGSVTCPAYKP